jgi:hypothetical protein
VTERAPSDFFTRLRAPGSAQHLALVRAAFAVHLFTVLITPATAVLEQVGGRPQPLAHTWLPAALEVVIARHIDALCGLGALAAVMVAAGLATRVALPLLLACFAASQNFYFRASVFHDDWLYFNAYLLVLCFAPCADAFALDAVIARRLRSERPPRAPQEYRWPIELMIAWFALIYGAAGIAKLFPLRKGIEWLSGRSTQQFAAEFVFDSPIYWLRGRPLFDYATRWPFQIASVLSVTIELSAIALLVSRRAYPFVLAAVLAMHFGIHAFGIPAFFQIALFSAVLLLPPERFPDARLRAESPVNS